MSFKKSTFEAYATQEYWWRKYIFGAIREHWAHIYYHLCITRELNLKFCFYYYVKAFFYIYPLMPASSSNNTCIDVFSLTFLLYICIASRTKKINHSSTSTSLLEDVAAASIMYIKQTCIAILWNIWWYLCKFPYIYFSFSTQSSDK